MIDRDPPWPLDQAPAARGSRLLGRCCEREASVSAESGAGDVRISSRGFEFLESLEPA
jgi:hypothetical protein